MARRLTVTLVAFAWLLAAPTATWASLISFRLNGTINGITDRENECEPGFPLDYNCAPLLESLYPGIPFELNLTYDTDAPLVFSVPLLNGDGKRMYGYDAIESATLQIGNYSPYVTNGGTLYLNRVLPGEFPQGDPGRVMFLFQGWSVPTGIVDGPNLTLGGLMTLTVDDPGVIDGSIPDSFTYLNLYWQWRPDGGYPTFVGGGPVEMLSPVPEPSTVALLGVGVLSLVVYQSLRRRSQRNGTQCECVASLSGSQGPRELALCVLPVDSPTRPSSARRQLG